MTNKKVTIKTKISRLKSIGWKTTELRTEVGSFYQVEGGFVSVRFSEGTFKYNTLEDIVDEVVRQSRAMAILGAKMPTVDLIPSYK